MYGHTLVHRTRSKSNIHISPSRLVLLRLLLGQLQGGHDDTDPGNPPLIREDTEDWMEDTVLGADNTVVRVVSESEALFNEVLLSPSTAENGDAELVVADCVTGVVMEDTPVETNPGLDAVSREGTDSVVDVDTLCPLALLPLFTEEPEGTDAVVGGKIPLLEAMPD
ncbi:hypothetical protein B0H13DRAFT_1850593 [Mycena leptocephala]|nr:hypothetical protein B0H13DRAFT_1850593 [Mycena leptocephala]